ncbi:SusC/RagA family TonB-linked outer membrane protein, partial [Pseudopedobacter sp.]|uniref:SusC/RagA family TonB-linked outer membrane protein n=1 Tax=Pseudopedobacter sp. TaxID=1936787 RepID=UPI0033420770
IRGGNRNTKYSLSGSVFDQNGIILNTGSKRYQGRLTIDQTISKKLRAGLTANYSSNLRIGQAVNAGVSGSNFTSYALYRTWAYRPIAGSVGVDLVEDVYDGDEFENTSDLRLNPIITSKNDYTHNLSANFMSNFYVEYDVLKKLKFKTTFSIASNTGEGRFFYNSNTPQGSPQNRSQTWLTNGRFSYSESTVWSNENFLTYNNTFNKVHKLEVMGGFSVQEGLSEAFGFTTKYIPTEDLGIYGLGLGTPHASVASGGEYGLVSYFGRLNYDFKSKYLFTATWRADGSSKFKKGNRFGFFPSAAFAWNMMREKFLKYNPVISESKIRVSYGAIGNNRIGNYDIYTQVTSALSNTYSFGNEVPTGGITISKVGNEELKWETTKQFNVGYDLGLFKNRVGLTFDYYKKVTEDLLINADMPTATGYERVFKNIGSLNNDGFEITLNTVNIKNKKFSWRSNFNISFNRNEIIELTRNQHSMFTSMTVGQNSASLYTSRIGYPAGMFFGYIFDGIYQVEDFDVSSTGAYVLKSHLPDNGSTRTAIQPGYIKYKDLNGDGTIDDKDMSVIGRGQPIHTGGFTNNFSYKNFYLNVFFQWSYGNQIYNANRMIFDGNYINLYNVNQYASFNDRWTAENRSNTIYKAGGQGPAGYFSDRTIEDGSYLRLKTVSLSYSIPSKYIKPLYLSKLNFRVAAQNLLTFTKYSGMDPEVSTRHSVLTPGFDYSPYPQARTITFGLSATF